MIQSLHERELKSSAVPFTMPMPKKIQKRQTTSLRRKQIISALRKLIIKHGSEHVTVRRIAREIGISQGAIYRHFKSKSAILSFLVDYIEENLIGDIERSPYGKDKIGLLENIMRNHLSAMEQRSGISFLVIAEIISLGDKKLNKKIFNVLHKYTDRIEGIITEGLRSGEIRGDVNPEIAAIIFLGMIQGLVSMWALGDYQFDLEQKYSALWNFFCGALKNPSP